MFRESKHSSFVAEMAIANNIMQNEQIYYGNPEDDAPITAETLFDFPPQE